MEVHTITLFKKVCNDVNLDPFTLRYCVRRLKTEGTQFLTVTLPQLSKAVLSSLELGYFNRPTCFAWKGRSLRYFRSFLNGIFDCNTGKVLVAPDPVALWQLRQLCEYAYKLALPFDEKALGEASDAFIAEDESLAAETFDADFVDQLRKDFETHYHEIARSTVVDVFKQTRPRPGPGTFSGKNQYEYQTDLPWYARKDTDYSGHPAFAAYVAYNKPYRSAPCPDVATSDPTYSEVLFVPKDSRGPRVIIREPFTLLRHQMAFNSFMTTHLTRVSRGRINFQDQSVNRELARTASINRRNVTMDLKSASDRVSYRIVDTIFRNSPLRKFIRSTTRFTKVPGKDGLHRLHKLSGMGSGVTFPVMSLLIYLAICREVTNRSSLSYSQVKNLVYVYGDDVIVPSEYAFEAECALSKVLLKTNPSKCFRFSHFRESCGGDYFYGQDVAPVRLKLSGASLTVSNRDCKIKITGPLAVLQLERHCRVLVRNGMISTADYLYSVLEKTVGKLPFVSGDSPVIGRYSVVPPTYQEDSTGAYRKIKCIFPVAKSVEINQCPHIFLGNFLAKVSRNVLDRLLYPDDGSAYGEVSIPRQVKYRRISVSAFRLIS